MNDESLRSGLVAALSSTPENHQLRLALAGMFVDAGEIQNATLILSGLPPAAALECDLRSKAAQALRAVGEMERAATYNSTQNDTESDTDLEGADDTTQSPRLTVVSVDEEEEDAVIHLNVPFVERITLDHVCGLEAVKKEIVRKIVTPFTKPSLYQKFRRQAGGGLLLYGPPGCGKTLLARATAGECGAEFLNVQISDILDMYLGESERKLSAIFDTARRNAPSVLFFDEIEALGAKRQYSHDALTSKLVSQFLAELDGFAQANENILVLAATNMPWAIDPALRRPGRIDRTFFVPPPDKEARLAILELEMKDRPLEAGTPLSVIAKATSGYSGADIKNVVETACDLAIERSISTGTESPVGMDDLRNALETTRNSTQEWLTTAKNYARYANEGGAYDDVLNFIRQAGAK